MLKKIQETSDFIRKQYATQPQVGIILGTGLGALVNEIDIKHSIDYEDLPNFPVSTVESHKGRLIFGTLGTKEVVVMQGRFHTYEGYFRDFYTGYLGTVNMSEESHIFVNLRCMQVLDNQAVLYAGGGITKHSKPQKEWEETEMKFKTLLQVL